MASTVTLTLDTAAPTGQAIDLAGGATTVSTVDVAAAISGTGATQMKIYGDVSDTFATTEYRALEANAPWIAFATTKTIRLAATDGVKTVRIKLRDAYGNETAEATDTVTLNTTVPVVTITAGPTPATISKIATFDTTTLSFQSDVAFSARKVKVVASATDPDTAGTLIPTTNGSTGTTGSGAAATAQTVTIKGADLEAAGVTGSPPTAAIVKVFVQASSNGTWSAGS